MNFDHISSPHIEHYGVKGMKWGQRKASKSKKTPAQIRARKKKVKQAKTIATVAVSVAGRAYMNAQFNKMASTPMSSLRTSSYSPQGPIIRTNQKKPSKPKVTGSGLTPQQMNAEQARLNGAAKINQMLKDMGAN